MPYPEMQPSEDQHAALEAGLDVDTVQHGTTPPFAYWEGDARALVGVLWSARHNGLTLDADAERIASNILASRCIAAVRHQTAEGNPSVRGFTTQADGFTGSADELAQVLGDAAAAGGDLSSKTDDTANFIRMSGWFAAIQRDAVTVAA
ncbi:hypothetical protein [Curtobacterium sp. MCSS17_016]|uniref:hypothetical protein n=1 Tax=Curtobacterium sp. MCSS17_016 TaxID=2175644 RepID=UPI0015E8C2AD|nr:hypothetical protein [Curtobacterium sp. MCSS17_016]WIE80941.1 hypothetical protein DEJ19_020710 [Curtobacterium sp. MCSS17_016]